MMDSDEIERRASVNSENDRLVEPDTISIVSTSQSCCSFSNWNFENLLIPSTIVFGVVLGVAIPGDPDLTPTYRPISGIIGWVYFFSWTLSFYPQIYQNFMRRSSVGLASDKIAFDLLGYSCLSVYSIAFFGIPSVRQMYADKNGGNTPRVDINDVCFAVHSLLMTLIQIVQMAWYDGWNQAPSRNSCFAVCFMFLLTFVYLLLVIAGSTNGSVFNLLAWLYFLSYVKIAVTLVKYVPQVILNYTRKSTVGWNITGVVMDIIGSLLSLLQLLLDCNDTHDWGGVTGNVVKLALGSISMVFDVIFILQHYVFYPVSAEYHNMPPASNLEHLLTQDRITRLRPADRGYYDPDISMKPPYTIA